jgi:hypothetical protein
MWREARGGGGGGRSHRFMWKRQRRSRSAHVAQSDHLGSVVGPDSIGIAQSRNPRFKTQLRERLLAGA